MHAIVRTKPRTTNVTVLLMGKRNSTSPRKKRKTDMWRSRGTNPRAWDM
jgi:hypothetical protein